MPEGACCGIVSSCLIGQGRKVAPAKVLVQIARACALLQRLKYHQNFKIPSSEGCTISRLQTGTGLQPAIEPYLRLMV